jgi:hypothetical protein
MRKKKHTSRRWISTAIPRTLAKRIREVIAEQGGYTGLTAFVADAVLRRIEQLEALAKQAEEGRA